MPKEFTTNPERVRRFAQEARAASALNHPNIITIYEIGQQEGVQFIVTEYIEGETLRQRLARGQIRLQEALDIVMQIATALTVAHKAGIIHRDIKPENLMVLRDGHVKVLDFGLAKFTEKVANRDHPSTQTGIIMGTPSYMSPEQARGLKMDQRTDIFSLGVVLYELLTKKQPFEGPTSIDVLTAILHQEPRLLKTLNADLPDDLQQVINNALQKDRDKRYPSVQEFLLALQQIRQAMKDNSVIGAKATAETVAFSTIHVNPKEKTRLDAGKATLPGLLKRFLIAYQITYKFRPGIAALILIAGLALGWLYIKIVLRGAKVEEIKTTSTIANETGQKPGATPYQKTLWSVDVTKNAIKQGRYTQKNEAQQVEFIELEARGISEQLDGNFTPLNPAAIQALKYWVDAYTKRIGNQSTRLWEEDLNLLFQRAATQFAPTIIRSFKNENVPPIMGLYIPIIESEYRNIASENARDGTGLFQFVGPVARGYGIKDTERTNVEKMSTAAARYIAERAREFGEDAKSMTLVLLSFPDPPGFCGGVVP